MRGIAPARSLGLAPHISALQRLQCAPQPRGARRAATCTFYVADIARVYRACAPCVHGTVQSNLTQKSYKRTLLHCYLHKNEWTAPQIWTTKTVTVIDYLIFLYLDMALTVAEFNSFSDGELLKTGLISNNLLPFIFVPALNSPRHL